MKGRALTAEQQTATTERRERFRALVKQIGAMSDADRAQFSAKMPALVTTEGRSLSLTNQLLCAHQRAGLTVVGGFKQWRAQGRAVRKGEHGLMIWFPRLAGGKAADEPRAGESTTTPQGFLIGYVFDVSQTDALEVAS